MPKVSINYWDNDRGYGYVSEDSQRDYESYTIAAATVPEYFHDRPEATQITLHIDEQTGVVVYDVAKYERSLR